MEGLRTFLENSTIHGLSYISTANGKLLRFAWTLIVIAGFTGAGFIIHESFKDWSDNPVTTTIETLPISDAMYPNVTVCPPKDTYLDLNYYSLIIGDTKFRDYTHENPSANVEELLVNFAAHFQQREFEKIFRGVDLFKEKDKYKNWYLGVSQVPIWEWEDKIYILNNIRTYATSGEVSSPYFGEKFDIDTFNPQIEYSILIYNPQNETIKSSLKIQYDIDEAPFEYLALRNDTYEMAFDSKKNEYETEKTINEYITILLMRDFPSLYLADWKAKRSTGFNITWDCDEGIVVENKKTFNQNKYNKIFVQIANLVHKLSAISEGGLMSIVKKIRSNATRVKHMIEGNEKLVESNDEMFEQLIGELKELDNDPKSINTTEPLYENEINNESLKIAAKIFFYILSPQPKDEYWTKWYPAYYYMLIDERMPMSQSLKRLLGEHIFNN